jgi:hypothetical protein
LARLNEERSETQKQKNISWQEHSFHESWDGLPGYEVEFQYCELASDHFRDVHEISDYIKGWLLSALFTHRTSRFNQSPDFFSYDQDRFRRTNSFYAYCGEPTIVGTLLSIRYAIHWYGAGAAHPNRSFRGFNFLLDPLVAVDSLSHIFLEPEIILPVLQQEIRSYLYGRLCEDKLDEEKAKRRREWIDTGTSNWADLDTYAFVEQGVEVIFEPYRVADYASGTHSYLFTYDFLVPLMKADFVSAMNLERFL